MQKWRKSALEYGIVSFDGFIDIKDILPDQSIEECIGFQVVGEFQLLVLPDAEYIIEFFRLFLARFQFVTLLRIEYNVIWRGVNDIVDDIAAVADSVPIDFKTFFLHSCKGTYECLLGFVRIV